ncbi:YslB family protein [Listeria ilorinensis]|uniref:YslB family protein n=1 Tax=Listeria ilorinensis TaxID=2867439 RepID=UPI001EF3D6A6|nr:YslB family protein [Listeria ilorinensis]
MTEPNQEQEETKPTAGLNETSFSFGYGLLRDYLLPDLLGDETPHILYWAGKDLARKFPLDTYQAIEQFFVQASFGELSMIKEKKDELRLLLSGEEVARRFDAQETPSFKLEAGFLAEQLQNQRRLYTEAYDEINQRKKEATLIIKWDRKESIDNEDNY